MKAGHVPPDQYVYLFPDRQSTQHYFSKMESFIRSKYESRRWAMDGPPPVDPSILDNNSTAAEPVSVAETETPAFQPVASSTLISQQPSSRYAASPVVHSPLITRQPQLLSTSITNWSTQASSRTVPATTQPPAQPNQAAIDDSLLSLDFHPPTSSTANNISAEPKKGVKEDILSLFSTPAATTTGSTFGQFQAAPMQQQSSPWDSLGSYQPPQPTSMMGTSGISPWGANSGWNPPAAPPGNLWGNMSQQPMGISGNWDSRNVGSSNGGMIDPSTQKKDDVFGDLWGM